MGGRFVLKGGGGRVRIVIDTIPEDGVDVDIQSTTDWAVEVASDVLEVAPTEIQGSLRVTQTSRMVKVRGEVRASGPRTCERCGAQTSLVLGGDVELVYVPTKDAPSGHSEIRLAPGDLDVGWYSGGALVMADVLSEALALSLPPRIACTEVSACEARVAALLANANASSDVDISTSPFAALRDLT